MVHKHVYLLPGQTAYETCPARISTLLGSCVAVCLFDRRRNYIGMNHFMLPVREEGRLEAGKYGDYAIELLIHKALKSGSAHGDLVASIFGGGNVVETLICSQLSEGMRIGDRNIEIAEKLLRHHRIPVKRRDVGGTQGRKIAISSETGEVEVRMIESGVGAGSIDPALFHFDFMR